MRRVKITILNKLPLDICHGYKVIISFDKAEVTSLFPGEISSFSIPVDSEPHTIEAYHCVPNENSAKLKFRFVPDVCLCYDVVSDALQHLHLRKSSAVP